MAFLQFPNIQYFKILETNENARMGFFNLDAATELKYMMFTIFVRGVSGYPFNLRCNIYGNESIDDPIFSSDTEVISLSTLVPTPVNNWLGNIFFTFAGYPLNPNVNYYMNVQASSYTRNADSFYCGVNMDWYSPVNNALSERWGARIRPLGYR